MRTWNITHSKDGYSAQLIEVPFSTLAAQKATDAACIVTRHRFCGNFMSDWWWKTTFPFVKPRIDREDDDWVENSIASVIWNWNQNLQKKFWDTENKLLSVPITEEEARRIAPALFEYEDDDDDSMGDV